MKFFKKAKKAFTLVELVVVIAIIAILSGVSVAVYVGITKNARQSKAQSEATSIGTVVRAAVLAGDGQGGPLKSKFDNTKKAALLSYDLSKGILVNANPDTADGGADFTLDAATAALIIKEVYKTSEETELKASTLTGKVVTTGMPEGSKGYITGFVYAPEGQTESFEYTFVK